ncbi:MAG: hypothetical protein LBH15_01995 [Treponema sp.]|jgi:hypothetical protein|nr:hypothetical protein [Treponema sp.]
MSSVSVKQAKIKLLKLIRLIPLALPAFAMPLFAARWQPFPAAAGSPGAAFQNEAAAGRPLVPGNSGRGEDLKPGTAPDGPRRGLPEEPAPPGELARAFYRADSPDRANRADRPDRTDSAGRAGRENAESARSPGPARNMPAPGENTGPPETEPAPGPENTGGKTGGGEGWRLLGFIRDAAGIEHRYFKEETSGRIISLADTPEIYPAGADMPDGEGASTP